MSMTDTAKAFFEACETGKAGMAAPHIARLTPVFPVSQAPWLTF